MWWISLKKTLGSGSALGESLLEHGEFEASEPSKYPPVQLANVTDTDKGGYSHEDAIDEIVVDHMRPWDGETYKSLTDPGGTGTGCSPEKTGAHEHALPPATEHAESISVVQGGLWWAHIIWTGLRWRLYPNIYNFFLLRFYDDNMESQFRREAWFTTKRLALWASFFYVLNWLIGCILLPSPHPLMERIFYWGVSPALTLPLPFFVALDFPRRRNKFYQVFITCSTWSWWVSFYLLILCGFYPGQKSYFSCDSKDFLGLLYYASALPAIALFGLGQQRLPAMIPAFVILVIMSAWIVPFRHTWARSELYRMFLLWLHYLRENADRKLYSLREQLKVQFKATQKAQVNERKTADSKRRLTSYIFHEVRVPLNTAMLAVQNMEAHGSVPKGQDIEFAALEGSLSMMSKVLNDVLDFNRMDSGRFESVLRPYSFHTVLRSIFVPLQLAADARGLELHTDIDRRIDEVARTAWYQAQGETLGWIEENLIQDPCEEGIVVGDEMRLRQIVTNLASNACKFTASGGKINVRTRLVVPSLPNPLEPSIDLSSGGITTALLPESNRLSAHHLHEHNSMHTSPLESIVVRIEIQDTGAGIRSCDLVDNKLFSPYVQTEVSIASGGKGTGLGLALVRHIVKLSGGRLGVRSQLGVGSTFWVELPLGIGQKALQSQSSGVPDPAIAFKSPQSNTGLGDDQFAFHRDNATYNGGSFTPTSEQALEVSSDSSSLGGNHAGFLSLHPNHPAASALRTIMEQGGLVELGPRRLSHGRLGERVVTPATRTLSDASTELTATEAPPMGSESEHPRAHPNFISLPERNPMSFFPSPSTQSIGPPSPGIQRTINQSNSSPEPSLHFENPLNALVVDDDYITRQLMTRLLTRLGVSVTCAENGAIALNLIVGTDGFASVSGSEKVTSSLDCMGPTPISTLQQEHRFDVIYLDNQMPVMSGLEVVRRLREMGRTDFVVGVTGNALLSDQDEYLDAGANKVLTKPVQERSLKLALSIADQLKKQRSSTFEGPGILSPSGTSGFSKSNGHQNP
ncbi:hypothetical protein K439DRAFT_1522413 [Ramaria rubella]|nr:hypothetical protein K439DRAFT_1522413 [Ramaria rubella]